MSDTTTDVLSRLKPLYAVKRNWSRTNEFRIEIQPLASDGSKCLFPSCTWQQVSVLFTCSSSHYSPTPIAIKIDLQFCKWDSDLHQNNCLSCGTTVGNVAFDEAISPLIPLHISRSWWLFASERTVQHTDHTFSPRAGKKYIFLYIDWDIYIKRCLNSSLK